MTNQIPPDLKEMIEAIIAYQKQLELEKQKESSDNYIYIEEFVYEDPALIPREEKEEQQRGVIHIEL